MTSDSMTPDHRRMLRALRTANVDNLKTPAGDLWDAWPSPTSNWWAQQVEEARPDEGMNLLPLHDANFVSIPCKEFVETLFFLHARGLVRADEIPQTKRRQLDGCRWDETDVGTHRWIVTPQGIDAMHEKERPL